MEEESKYRSGYVTIVGPPNAGKSTLLNYLMGEKLSIVSPRPQTTRFLIKGVITFPEAQLIFVDTPGMQEADKLRTPVERGWVIQALKFLEETDVVMMIVEAHLPREEENLLIERLNQVKKPVLLAINKIDKLEKDRVERLIEEYKKAGNFSKIIPISAKKGTNISILVGEIILALPERPPIYPEDVRTDFPRELWIAEVIREKIFQVTYQEIPYAALVKVDNIEDKKKVVCIQATIYMEEPSQKGIIIGKGANKLKEIGIRARKDLEAFFHKKVYLGLEVKVEKGWRRKEILSKREESFV
ncbi:MAG: GTPase Era [Caldiserica bacterium]|nr:GTPase Era [Caldisericota bacterium]